MKEIIEALRIQSGTRNVFFAFTASLTLVMFLAAIASDRAGVVEDYIILIYFLSASVPVMTAALYIRMAIPVYHILMVVRAAEHGNLSVRIPDGVGRHSIFGEIATSINRMLNRLQKDEKLKKDFINGVSHELRTPLTTITGYTEFLEDGLGGTLSPEQKRFVYQIQASATRLSRLVDDLLDFARLEAGTFQLAKSQGDLTALIEDEVANAFPRASEENVLVQAELPHESIVVSFDCGRIGQVITNLIGNAVKFTQPGGLVIVSLDDGQDEVVVHVRDNGPGISPDNLSRIFDKFYQVDPSSTREKGGAGLGLSISKALVEAHGGRMWVTSELNEGSTFSFSLPKHTSGALIKEEIAH